MCGNPVRPRFDPDFMARAAATSLARLMETGLGYSEGHIDPIALRLFIQNKWTHRSFGT